MAKKVANILKLQIPAGGANPSPPVGPALGQVGVNIMDFCNAFNSETQNAEKGLPLPVVITVYEDKSFTFVVKTPPAAVLIKKALGIPKGSGEPNKEKIGRHTSELQSHHDLVCRLLLEKKKKRKKKIKQKKKKKK